MSPNEAFRVKLLMRDSSSKSWLLSDGWSYSRASPSLAVTRFVRPRTRYEAIASGRYMPNTGQFAMLMAGSFPGPSRSLPSRPAPGRLWSLSPRPTRRRNTPFGMSSSAIALFSWSVTHAVFESSEAAMYSGSKSCATLAPGPKRRMRGSSPPALKASKPAATTSVCVMALPPFDTSMMLTDPTGSVLPGP